MHKFAYTIFTLLMILLFTSCLSGKDPSDVLSDNDVHSGPPCLCRKAKILGGSGKSADDPMIMKGKNPEYAEECQFRYISSLPCGEKGTWTLVDKVTERSEKAVIQEVAVRCEETGEKRTYYFDVSMVKTVKKNKD